ncbi:hypothetical protein ACIQWN_34630, partial [Streptomyces vinaceus]|uniref:hypothetical protein n=1 Tax=Streptomyces vinaceus TaxID=1960 RepID=UPI00382AF44C
AHASSPDGCLAATKLSTFTRTSLGTSMSTQTGRVGHASAAEGLRGGGAAGGRSLLACCKIGSLSEHPLGIVQVRPEEDRLTLRLLDEPYVVHHWAEFLLPRLSGEESDHPLDRVLGAGLRYRRESGGISLYRPGAPSSILLTGFNPRWWERIADRLTTDYGLLQQEPDWTPTEGVSTSTPDQALQRHTKIASQADGDRFPASSGQTPKDLSDRDLNRYVPFCTEAPRDTQLPR